MKCEYFSHLIEEFIHFNLFPESIELTCRSEKISSRFGQQNSYRTDNSVYRKIITWVRNRSQPDAYKIEGIFHCYHGGKIISYYQNAIMHSSPTSDNSMPHFRKTSNVTHIVLTYSMSTQYKLNGYVLKMISNFFFVFEVFLEFDSEFSFSSFHANYNIYVKFN